MSDESVILVNLLKVEPAQQAEAKSDRKDRNMRRRGIGMSVPKAVFVLVHGGWHNRSAWDKVTPILEAHGFAVLALDLPGAGVNSRAPESLGRRPFAEVRSDR